MEREQAGIFAGVGKKGKSAREDRSRLPEKKEIPKAKATSKSHNKKNPPRTTMPK